MLLGARQFFWLNTKKALPYDAEVEYLQSTGTQWIDTGVEGKSGLSANIVFMFSTGMVGGDKYVIGAVGAGATRCYFGTYQSKWMFGYRSYYTADGIQDNVQYDAQVSWLKGNQYVKVSGVDIITATDDTDFNTGRNLYLFTRNNNGATFSTYTASAKIYSCKIWDNGVLVRDMIPVRVGSVGYMYDKVSGTLFGNAGTGDFVLGPDIVEVEYLESTGTQYIDTGLSIDTYPNLGFNIRLNPLESATADGVTRAFCGCSNYGSRWFGVNFTALYSRGIIIGLGSNSYISNDMSLADHTLYVSSVDGVWYDGTNTGSTYAHNIQRTGTTFLLFAICARDSSSVNHISPRKCRVYYLKMYNGSELIQDLVPVIVGGEGAMMDRLTRKIYRNAGTGKFKVGPIVGKATARSYVQDGLIAQWDGIENAGFGTHGASATSWKDLVRNIDATYSIANETPNWKNDCWESVSAQDGKVFHTTYPDLTSYNGHTVEVVVSKNTEARGVIIGSYGFSDESGAKGKNFEWYSNNVFRAYYDNINVFTSTNSFPINQRCYFATIKDDNSYKVVNGNGVVLVTVTGEVQINGTHCNIGCDNRTGGMCLNGEIYTIRIYSRALTEEEIAINNMIDKKRFNLP